METPDTTGAEKKASFPNVPTLFLGGVFLLFPIAHLSVFGLPLYLSEVALLVALSSLFGKKTFFGLFQDFSEWIRKEKVFFLGIATFLFGVSLSIFLNPYELSAFGRFKSFYLIPLLLLFTLLIGVKTAAEWRWIIQNWLWGIMAAALASLVAASEGFLLYDGRLAGLYHSANYLALLVAPGVLISIFLLVTSRSWKEKSFGFMGLFLSLSTLILTRSYAAWVTALLAVLVMGVLLFVKKRNFRRFFFIFLLPVTVFCALLSFEQESEKWEQLVSLDERSSLASRMMIWRAGLDIAGDHSLFGIGTARFQTVYLEYQDRYAPYLEWAVPTPHNLLLHFLLEGGIFALMGWVVVVISVSLSFWQWWGKSEQDNPAASEVLLAASLVIFYLIYGLVDTPYMKNDLVLAIWGSLALLLVILRIRG